MAESVMKHLIQRSEMKWYIDSAGLRNWNVGCTPEPRCVKVLTENGLSTDHIGRTISKEDFVEFDFIFGMDEANLKELQQLASEVVPRSKTLAKIELFGKYIDRKEDQIICDPYFTSGLASFRCIFLQITECCSNFIATQLAAQEITN